MAGDAVAGMAYALANAFRKLIGVFGSLAWLDATSVMAIAAAAFARARIGGFAVWDELCARSGVPQSEG